MNNPGPAPKYGNWWRVPEPVLIKVFLQLRVQEVLKCSLVCKRWQEIATTEYLWHKLFLRDFDVQSDVAIKPGAESWRQEYARISSDIPSVNTEILYGHTNQVLHVSFSNNGKWFATCSKDANCIVWTATHPATKKYTYNMRSWSWKYTQWSAFNKSDTALLISGVQLPSINSVAGEIAVYAIDDENTYLKCRVRNRPYDVFGTWFSEKYLLSGDLYWLSSSVSCSIVWLNKADQEISSATKPVLTQLYKFYNPNGSSIRSITVADCPWFDNEKEEAYAAEAIVDEQENAAAIKKALQELAQAEGNPDFGLHDAHILYYDKEQNIVGNPLQDPKFKGLPPLVFNSDDSTDIDSDAEYPAAEMKALPLTIRYVDAFRRKYGRRRKEVCSSPSRKKSRKGTAKSSSRESSPRAEDVGEGSSNSQRNESSEERVPPNHSKYYVESSSDDDEEYRNPKYLIFTAGYLTYTPHQIAIKRMKNVHFPKLLDPGPSLKERIEKRRMEQRERRMRVEVETDWNNFPAVADKFDRVDKVIEMHGHITGMALSPDQRYLYVNVRAWPQGYVITDYIHPPPIAQEIDIHVIDLKRMTLVGKTYRAHKAFTGNIECFFIFLSVSDDYVASGAEDRHAYIWDRYYGMCLAKYPHEDVVNSVAFSPKSSDLLITASDDHTIKVWRSRATAKSLNVEILGEAAEFRKKKHK